MFIDSQMVLSSAQAVTSSAASTNYYDAGAATRELGITGQQRLKVYVTCTTTCTAAGSATVQFQLQNAAASSFASPVNVVETDAIPKATLVAGYSFYIPVPIGTTLEFLRLNYNVATGPLTAGAFTAEIVTDEQAWTAYPTGTN